MTNPSAVFISDVHVPVDGSPVLQPFLDFLRLLPGRADRLFILGDLFDLWAGHADARRPACRRVLDALENLPRQGVDVVFVAGNRDLFLHDYLRTTGRLPSFPDQCLVDLEGRRFLLCHGDLLFARDRSHLRLRRILASKPFRTLFLALPAFFASFLARSLRSVSQCLAAANPRILTVDEQALRALCSSGVDVVVCGHTHRPEHRTLDVDGRPCELFVLDAWIERPGFLEFRNGGFAWHAFPDDL